MRECRQCGMPLHTTAKCPCEKSWQLGQYVRIWKNEGYEYGHIQEVYPEDNAADFWTGIGGFNGDGNRGDVEVMLVGDDGKEIYGQVKDLEEGE